MTPQRQRWVVRRGATAFKLGVVIGPGKRWGDRTDTERVAWWRANSRRWTAPQAILTTELVDLDLATITPSSGHRRAVLLALADLHERHGMLVTNPPRGKAYNVASLLSAPNQGEP